MNLPHFAVHLFRHAGRRLAAAVALLALVVACGGGGDGGVGTGGTGSFASGPITGFGSVVVNGVHYEPAGDATIDDDDGIRRDVADLRLGMTVAIDAGPITDDPVRPRADATRIRIVSELQGPVDAVDVAARTLTLLGQAVQVGADTVFDERLAGGLAALTRGRELTVYGLRDASSGRIAATRIEPSATPGARSVRGPVASVDEQTVRIGGGVFAHGMMGGGQLTPGRFVKLRLDRNPDAGGRWVVNAVDAGRQTPSDRDEAEVEGLVAGFVAGSTSFSVDGLSVDAAGASVEGTLRNGARVEVEGMLRAGVLVASRVRVEADGEGGDRGFELEGAIEAGSLDRVARRFVLRGVTVHYGAGVQFDKGGEADLRDGRRLEVRGLLSADGTRLEATRIRFDD